ncbi:MAG: helix-turn-helix transcriptional regulator [Lachnospiraceae bacterium]|nr:helix-turn-helix transcriptional regulator [Lachnospiraceae bacterium]
MTYSPGIGLKIKRAIFVQEHPCFKDTVITKERTVTRFELVLFLKDGGYSVINGKKHIIHAGSVRFHRPGDKVYSYRFNEVYVVHFQVDNVEIGREMFKNIPSFITIPNVDKEISILKKLIVAYIAQDGFECMNSLWYLLGRIKEQYQMQERNNKTKTITQIKNYIDENYRRQITLEDIAQAIHMHPVYIQRKFKKEAGISPAEYQKNVRLSNAIIYLRTTNLSIEDIADLCGFSNSSHFIRAFKAREQITPLQYRQRNNVLDILS